MAKLAIKGSSFATDKNQAEADEKINTEYGNSLYEEFSGLYKNSETYIGYSENGTDPADDKDFLPLSSEDAKKESAMEAYKKVETKFETFSIDPSVLARATNKDEQKKLIQEAVGY